MAKGFGRGGAREGSGRKPKYLTDNETLSIKVPAKHKEDVRKMVEIIDELIAQGFTVEQVEELLKKAMEK
ncbi:MAG: hypothetical protein KME45_21550 [Stenomitos rutilans HA7619-LM2]|jgi:DNA-binding transcriptional regulator YhcF (GntR family)|nr:hypothetical protein [Stenomitos rutilans HA7619-LM2]